MLSGVMVNELDESILREGYGQVPRTLVGHVHPRSSDLAEHRRVYILAHTNTDEFGNVRMKTVGKMVDVKCWSLKASFTIVLRTKKLPTASIIGAHRPMVKTA